MVMFKRDLQFTTPRLGDASLVAKLAEDRQALLEERPRCSQVPLFAGHQSQAVERHGAESLFAELPGD